MQNEDIISLSKVRLEHAEECIAAAKQLMLSASYKSAANRAYYAVFHAIRAVLAFDLVDMKKHSGIISEFRRRYIKPGIFDAELSESITILFDIRTDSDYDDFFIISKAEVEDALTRAEEFVCAIKTYLEKKYI